MTYKKGSVLSVDNSGLQFSWDSAVVRDAIILLKATQPTTRVMLAVGGASYQNWGGLNAKAIKDLVRWCLPFPLACSSATPAGVS